jgi:hypothetical protein
MFWASAASMLSSRARSSSSSAGRISVARSGALCGGGVIGFPAAYPAALNVLGGLDLSLEEGPGRRRVEPGGGGGTDRVLQHQRFARAIFDGNTVGPFPSGHRPHQG